MDREQHEEWRSLQERAKEQLRSGQWQHRLGTSVVQMLTLPSFAPAVAWDLLSLGCGEEIRFNALRRIWRWDLDRERLATPVERLRHPRPLEPTFEVTSFELPADLGRELSAAVESLRVPVIAGSGTVGCDGTTVELAFERGFVSSRYCWWEEAPPEWADLERFAERLVQRLEALGARTEPRESAD